MSFFRRRWSESGRRRAIFYFACVVSILGVIYFWNDFCLWRATSLMALRDHKSAAQWINRSLWLHREVDARTCFLQLRLARRSLNFSDVENKLREAGKLKVPLREIQRERWLAMAQTNQFAGMQAYWTDLLNDPRDDGPEIARAYYAWSMLSHNLPQAARILKLWQQDEPRNPEPLELEGRFYQSQSNWEAAEDSYRHAVTLAPDNDELRLSFAKALQVRLKTKEAIPIYEDYRRRHPDDVAAYNGLAQCAAADGDLETAIGLMRTAVEKSPDDFATLKTYGELLLSSGDAAGAVAVLEKAHRAVPEHAKLAYLLARALKASGRGDEAKPLFDFVAESRTQLDDLVHLEEQLRRQPNDLQLRMKIASITARYVSRQDAIRWYEALLQIAPNYSPAHQALAELSQQTGDNKTAPIRAGSGPRISRSSNEVGTISIENQVPSRETSSNAR